jgi:uncharacterized protein YdbL (DUF1318 family)
MLRFSSLNAALVPLAIVFVGCSLKFEVVTQKTALERQILGSLAEIDEDYVLSTSVRGRDASKKGKKISIYRKAALDARQNQEFNRDDLDELKLAGFVGESRKGLVIMLSTAKQNGDAIDQNLIKFGQAIAEEENNDRREIVQRMRFQSPELQKTPVSEIWKTYAKSMLEKSPKGTWYQNKTDTWLRK